MCYVEEKAVGKGKTEDGLRESGFRIPDEKDLSGCPMPEAQCRRIAPPINKQPFNESTEAP
jgi:hypothetical protein